MPYSRQQTYTKFTEGLDNLGFDENADARATGQKDVKKTESPTRALSKISENNDIVAKKVEKKEEQKKEEDVKELERKKQ